MRICLGLEGKGDKITFRIGDEFHWIAVFLGNFLMLRCRGQHIDNGLHQRLHTQVLTGCAEHHWHHRSIFKALLQVFMELLVADLLAFQIALGEIFIVLGDGFHQSLAVELNIVGEFGGNLRGFVFAIAILGEHHGFLAEEIDNAAEIGFLTNWKLQWSNTLAERLDHCF